MLRYLLDEHISGAVAEQIFRKNPHISVVSIHQWHKGGFLGRPDFEILEAAVRERLTLVTYDLRTIPILLRQWEELGQKHGGVVFVADRSIRANDFGGLVRGLIALWDATRHEDGTNRVYFLKPIKHR